MEMTFGTWLKVRRRQLDITQAELAKRASCSLVTIRKIEQNDRRPSKALAAVMATALAIPAETITDFVTFARTAPDGTAIPTALQSIDPLSVQPASDVRQASAQTSRARADTHDKPYRLPRPTTPFIGREAEIASVIAFLSDPNVSLVSILGPGGMGKTRLALAAADRLYQSPDQPFVDGIVFIALASLNASTQIAPTLADSLAIPIDAGREIRQQLLAFLAPKQMLLILDNCEHLLDGVGLFEEILRAAPGVCILVTSRERLALQAEQAFPIAGLGTLEDTERDAAEILDHPAIQLLRQSAQRAAPTFSLRAEDLPHAVRICRLVAGMPLGIEVAAGWVGMMSLAAIADEIQCNLDFLESNLRDIPDRHRSIRAVFDTSWHHLDPQEQTIFRNLAIFRGGFSRAAATHVVGASLKQLGHLIYKSLLHYDRDRDRYMLHELLRQYAGEELAEDPAAESVVRERHRSYYLSLLGDRWEALQGAEQEVALADIDMDIDNIRLAWRAAVTIQPDDQDHLSQQRAVMDPLGFYAQWRVHPEQGYEAFKLVSNEIDANTSATARITVIRALAWQAAFCRQLGRVELASELLEKAMTHSNDPGLDPTIRKTEQAFLYYQWGYCLERRQNERSLAYFRKSIALWEELGDNWWTALGFSGLGFNLSWSNRFLEARDYLQKSITLFERYGNARELVSLHERMSDSCQFKGDLDAARYHGQRALTLAEGAGNRKALADALRRMSVVVVLTEGNLEKADELNDRALMIYQSLNTQIEYAIALAQRAKHSLARGHMQAAEQDFCAAQEIFKEQQLRQGEGYLLRWLAIVAQMNGQQTDALAMINTSIEIFEEVGSGNFIPHLRVIRFLIDKKAQPPSDALAQLADVLHAAIENREYIDILWSLPAIAYCLLQEKSSAADNCISQQIVLAAEISGFIGMNFEYGQSAYMRSLVHDEVDALLAPWPQTEIAAAQARGQKTTVWEIAESVWGVIRTDTTQYPSHNTENLNSDSDNISMPPDSLCLLGTFQLIHHQQPIVLGQPRLEELLALLALRPGTPVVRAQIAYHFWPDSSERQARTNARNLLYKLKQVWPQVDEVIDIGRAELTWRADAGIALDIQDFVIDYNRADAALPATERVPLLTEAVAHYGGDFLPGSYADWVLSEREQLRLRFVTALEALIDGLLELRRYEEALQRATQLRDHDPLHEASYRRLMQIHSLRGDRVAALRVYHECVSMLEKELGVEPSAATLQLHAQLVQRPPATDQPDSSATTQRPRLIGRHAEWQQLQRVWRTVQTGNAHAVIIWGEAGIGKTRLAEELLDWVQRLGHTSASSRSYAAQGALSYAPITEWLSAPTIKPALSAVDDLYRVELARLLPELLADRSDLPPPGPLTEIWQQQRFFQSIAQALAAVSGPLLLHLDDMQWSDQETLTLLQFLLHSTRTAPLLILGTVRTEDAVENQPLHDLIAALRHQNQLTEMTLPPLSQAEVAELAEQTAGTTLQANVAQALYTASEGHPLFLIESVRSDLTVLSPHIGDGVAKAASAAQNGLSLIPPKIYNLFVTRLGQLSATAQQVATIAAVIGRAFTYPVLQAATTLDELALVDALDELWTRRIIREQGGDRYDFSHDRIREVAYGEISRARRRLLHRRVAQALEAIYHGDQNGVAGELAAHYAQAGDSEHAFIYYHRAAKAALSQYALVQAEVLFDAALVHAPDEPALRIPLLQEQTFVFHYAMRLERWRENLDTQQKLLDTLDTPDLHLQMEIELGYSEYERGTTNPIEAAKRAQAALLLAESLDDEASLANCYIALGNAQWMQTHLVEARDTFGQAVNHANRAGNRTLEAHSLVLQAQTGMFSGMSAQQIETILQQALVVAEGMDDRLEMANLYHKLSYLPVAQGMGGFDRAEQNSQRALALARAIGHRIQEENTLSNMGILFSHQGDHRRALEMHALSLELVEDLVDHWRRWPAIGYLGGTLIQIGDLARARMLLTDAGEGLQQIGSRHFEVKIRSELGLLHHLAGDENKAQEELQYLLCLLADHGDLRYEALVHTRLGYVLEASGQLVDATSHYEQGRTLHAQMEQHYYAMNALAGSARVAMHRGDNATAYAHAQTIWQTISGQETDATVETARTLRTCYEIFQQQGDPQAAAVLDTAVAQLRRRAATIDDAEYRAQFWQLADHRFFREVAGDLIHASSA